MEFKLEEDKSLNVLYNNIWTQVELKNCFPENFPNGYYSIRDEHKNELFLLKSLDELDEVNLKTVKDYLRFKNFVFEITGIYSITEEFGIRNWSVETKEGGRLFQTELDFWPIELKSGDILVRDIYTDQYLIKSLDFGNDLLKRYC